MNNYLERYNKKPNLETIVSGYREVMTLKTNLNKIYNNENIYLVDRFNNKYRIKERDNITYIYEHKKFIDNYNYYKLGINVLRDEKVIE